MKIKLFVHILAELNNDSVDFQIFMKIWCVERMDSLYDLMCTGLCVILYCTMCTYY